MELSIDIEDLFMAENDLRIDDKISILFLLMRSDQTEWTLQTMLNLMKFPNSQTNFLEEITKLRNSNSDQYSKHHIVEAFTIVGAFEILENLGLDLSDIKNSFVPNDLNKSFYINRNQKIIYLACETVSSSDCDKFSKYLQRSHQILIDPCAKQLEILITYLICENQLQVGQDNDECNLSILFDFLELIKLKEPIEILKNIPQMKFDSVSYGGMYSPSTNHISVCNRIENDFYIARRCLVLIINQEKFYSDPNLQRQDEVASHSLTIRRGTQYDELALKNLFENFKYHVITKNNLTDIEMIHEIQQAVQKVTRENFDGFITCLLSHGEEGVIYGANSIPVNIRKIKSFIASPNLMGIPKILLIQACQGTSLQKAVERPSTLEFDAPSVKPGDSPFADMFTFWSTIEGFASIRQVDKGTWFVQEFVNAIKLYHKANHLFEISTKVINEISKKFGPGKECMLPRIDTTFRKNFIFPGYQNPILNNSSEC